MSDPLAELRETFFLECDELLEKLETDLLALEAGSEDEELVNSAFRAVHSIKGGAGAFGMTAITETSHVFETVMDHVRSGELKLDPDLCALFLRSKDLLSGQIAQENGGEAPDPAEIEAVHSALEEICPEEEQIDADAIFQPVSLAADLGLDGGGDGTSDPLDILAQFEASDDEDEGPENADIVVAFAPKAEFYARGNDAGPFIRELRELGDATVLLDSSRVPSFDELDPTAPYFEWQITLDSHVDRMHIDDIFDFVADDCDISVGHSEKFSADEAEEAISPVELSSFIDFETEDEAQALEEQTDSPVVSEKADEDDTNDSAALPDAENASVALSPHPSSEKLPEEADQSAPSSPQATRTIQPKPVVRVELGRVDRLINLVSELVISQSMLSQAVEDHHGGTDNQTLLSGLDEFRQLTRELQESVMAIRAEPVRSTFMRMGQIARSTAASCDKKVKLVTEGEHTEVDKTVIERLAEPLTHMIRNAIDHGIEGADDRAKAGKDEVGTIHLSADHHSGRVVLTVSDDGAGVNRERVRAKAIEKEIIPPDAQLTDSEIDQLLFAPGFSTAAAISQVSGRGVGMDVVKREISSLGGRINISSKPGQGTTFTISLPLTLAVLDGMVIRVAEQTVVLPLSVIAESLRPEGDEIQNIGEEQVIFVRGQFVPILDVGEVLGYRPALDNFSGKVMLLVENDSGLNFACAVDEIIDQRQVVIKGLQDNYGRIEGVAAATILGDGQIALILDVNDLTAEQTALGTGYNVSASAKEAVRV